MPFDGFPNRVTPGREARRPAPAVLVTCEHGGNRIPASFRTLFAGHDSLLASHRGWDPGALPLAEAMARELQAPLHYSRTSRLLVDLNRSLGHPGLFSSITRALPTARRQEILQRWYRPYREAVTGTVLERIRSGLPLLHLAVHTFTPVLEGKVRDVEIGLLYDPAREGERAFCRSLKESLVARLASEAPPVRIRMNRPYLGTSDGFPTALREHLPPDHYLGVELEVSQGLILGRAPQWRRIRGVFLEVIGTAAGR